MLSFFKSDKKLGDWYSYEGNWKINIRKRKRYSWTVSWNDKIIKRGSGMVDFINTVDTAYDVAQKLKKDTQWQKKE